MLFHVFFTVLSAISQFLKCFCKRFFDVALAASFGVLHWSVWRCLMHLSKIQQMTLVRMMTVGQKSVPKTALFEKEK